MGDVVFYVTAFFAITGGVLMVSFRSPLSGAFSLVLSLVSIAVLFASLLGEFIFILQILVYAGAIMVLIVFTIMLLNLDTKELHEVPVSRIRFTLMAVVCGVLAFGFVRVFARMTPRAKVELASDFGSIEAVGRTMLGTYLYPFEIISLVLLVAVVGVVLLAKREI
ncbi:MAG: NADH-quinone oxidoreductase subunit J [Candidatus Krumholzibacteriota bacterium]|nr:NADH-quinone oxidoreductase subunit J [Candidatus Krumholzibacteriota bacterium]